MRALDRERKLVLLRRIGFVLFLAAFAIPAGHAVFIPTEGAHAHDYLLPFAGARVFLVTPRVAFALPLWRGPPIDDGFTPYEIVIRVLLLAAWASNFLIFFRLPKIAAFGVICLPWLTYVFWLGLAAAFVPFYFWSVGITLIHLPSVIGTKTPNKSPETNALPGQ